MKTHRVSLSMNCQYKKFSSHPYLIPHYSFIQLKQMINSNFKSKYSLPENIYNTKIVNELIQKSSTHIVAQLKDFLLYEDKTDFLQKTYKRDDIKINLPQILEYYNSCSVIFPNYVVLYESKYIYKNIQKKQKVIDSQQKQEIERENKLNCSFGSSYETPSNKIFDTQIFDSLLNQTNTSSIQQLLGFQYDERIDSFELLSETISKRENSIEALISQINQAEKNIKPFIEMPTHSSLKKYTSTIKYSNCTTTTKDKSSSICNQTCNRKVIICNKISNTKEPRIKTHNKIKHHKSPSRPISNEASHNTSFNKEKLYISSSSKNTILNANNNKVDNRMTMHMKNTLSMPKMDNFILNAPVTSRERKSKNAIIDLLASRIIKMKSITKKISESESKQNFHQNKKTLHLALSIGVSSLNNKIFKLKDHFIEKETHINNNNQQQQKYQHINSNNKSKNRMVNSNNYIDNRNSNANILISNKPLIKHREQIPISNSKTSMISKKTFNKIRSYNHKINKFSISPNKQITNGLITKTCTHLPFKSCLLSNEGNYQTSINTLLASKDSAIKSIHLKGIDYINRNDSRNNCNTDRTYNKKPSFQKVKYIKLD